MLCIEIDGPSHIESAQAEYDAARTAYLEELGYQVIRFTNSDVRYHLQAVVAEILNTIYASLSPSPFQGEGWGEGKPAPE